MIDKSKSIFALTAIGSAIFLGACTHKPNLTENPVPTNFSQESMYKLNSVAHWNNVAVDMAGDVAKKYGSGKGCIPGSGCEFSIYVKPQVAESKFSLAFRSQLISALVNQGLPVVTKPNDKTTIVDVDIQTLLTNGGRVSVEYDREPSELIDGVWVIKDLSDTSVRKFAGATAEQWSEGKAKKYPWFKSPHFVPVAEILVSVSFVNGDKYLARTSNMYYVSDVTGYMPAVQNDKAKNGKGGPIRASVGPMPVVGDCTPGRCEVR